MAIFLDVLTNLASLENLWINQQLIYNVDGDVVGRLEVHHIDEHRVNVNIIAVYPEYRNKGLFRQVINLIARSADQNGDYVTLTPMATETSDLPASGISTSKLRSIYEEYGFKAHFAEMEITDYTRDPIAG